jgi:hypothetical protein
VSTYDQRSIMHYWQAECNGTSDSQQEISPRDAQGAQRLYGAPIRTRQVALRTFDGCYLSAQNNGGSGLYAQASWIGPWETFDLVDVAPGQVALRSVRSPPTAARSSRPRPSRRSRSLADSITSAPPRGGR